MSNKSKVSVVVTTKNEEKNIKNCLKSIISQTYKNTEVIVVDNNSTDNTKKIAKKYTDLVFNKGPERSAQRNFGAKKAKGKYFLFLDADMILEQKVIEECVKEVQSSKFKVQSSGVRGVIIPEKSIGKNFWGKVKAFERSFYIGDDSIEAARFFTREAFYQCDGYNEGITGPEDWDISQKVREKYKIGRIKHLIIHNEADSLFIDFIKKKYYYGKGSSLYIKNYPFRLTGKQSIYLFRSNFYKEWRRFIKKPDLACGIIVLLVFEQLAGVLGFLRSKLD